MFVYLALGSRGCDLHQLWLQLLALALCHGYGLVSLQLQLFAMALALAFCFQLSALAFNNYCQGCCIERVKNFDTVVKAIEDAKTGWKSSAKAI